eukprot:Ihof_evm5s225 gene=Ihof_evmTU5s225
MIRDMSGLGLRLRKKEKEEDTELKKLIDNDELNTDIKKDTSSQLDKPTGSSTTVNSTMQQLVYLLRLIVLSVVGSGLMIVLAIVLWVAYDSFPYIRANHLFSLIHKDRACANAGQYLRINGWEAAQGLHVVCLHSNSDGKRVADVWKNVQIWDHHVLDLDGVNTTKQFRTVFDNKIIELKPVTKLAKLYQNPWEIFTPKGQRLDTLPEMEEEKVVLLFEGGHYLYQGFYIGHNQSVELDIGNTMTNITLTTVSMNPLLFSLDKFATQEEEAAIIEQAMPTMAPSEVLNGGTDTVGSKKGIWAVVQYKATQRLHAHHDYHVIDTWSDKVVKEGMWNEKLFHGFSNRFATVLFYMNDIKKGGETWFASNWLQLFIHNTYQAKPPGMCSFGTMTKPQR